MNAITTFTYAILPYLTPRIAVGMVVTAVTFSAFRTMLTSPPTPKPTIENKVTKQPPPKVNKTAKKIISKIKKAPDLNTALDMIEHYRKTKPSLKSLLDKTETELLGGFTPSSINPDLGGLTNLGVTCGMNSALQILLPLYNSLENLPETTAPLAILLRAFLAYDGKLTQDALDELGFKDQAEFLSILREKLGITDHGHQQDVSELFRKMLDALDYSYAEHPRTYPSPALNSPASLINCPIISPSFQVNVVNYFSEEITDRGRRKQNLGISNHAGEAPKVIMFELQRSLMDGQKDNTAINFPADQEIRVPIYNPASPDTPTYARYQLTSFSCHQGEVANGGHHYACARSAEGWKRYNDSRVTPLNSITEDVKNGSLFAFKLIDS